MAIFDPNIFDLSIFDAGVDYDFSPATASLSAAPLTPVAAWTDHRALVPASAAATLTGNVSAVLATAYHFRFPITTTIALTAYQPNVITGNVKAVITATGSLITTRFAPTVTRSTHRSLVIGVRELALLSQTPNVARTGLRQITPSTRTVAVTGLMPGVLFGSSLKPLTGAATLTGLGPVLTRTEGHLFDPSIFDALVFDTGVVVSSITRTPPHVSLSLTGVVPKVAGVITIKPLTGSSTLTGLAPELVLGRQSIPATRALTLTGLAPVVSKPAHRQITPATATAALVGNTLSIQLGGSRSIIAGTRDLAITGRVPVLAQSTYRQLTPATATLALTGLAPSAAPSIRVFPPARSVALNGHAPSVARTEGGMFDTAIFDSLVFDTSAAEFVGHIRTATTAALTIVGLAPVLRGVITLKPALRALVLAGQSPSLQLGGTSSIVANTHGLVITGYAPSVVESGVRVIRPPTRTLTLTRFAPSATRTQGLMFDPDIFDSEVYDTGIEVGFTRRPSTAALTIARFAPTVATTGVIEAKTPLTAALSLTGRAPSFRHGGTSNIVIDTVSLFVAGSAPAANISGAPTGFMFDPDIFDADVFDTVEPVGIERPRTAQLLLVPRTPVVDQSHIGEAFFRPPTYTTSIISYPPLVVQQVFHPFIRPATVSLTLESLPPQVEVGAAAPPLVPVSPIAALPLMTFVMSTGDNEDWLVSFQYIHDDGLPMNLSAFEFDMDVRTRPPAREVVVTGSTRDGRIRVGGIGSSFLVIHIPVEEMDQIAAGKYVADIVARDDGGHLRTTINIDLTVFRGITTARMAA